MSEIFPKELPSVIKKNPLRNAEINLFNGLKDAKLFSTTRIYYSVSWMNKHDNRSRQKDGECDFIITDEIYGIIFIEVKGGEISKNDQNQWFSGDIKIKNPIKQCNKSMYQIMQEFRKRWKEKKSNEDYPKFFYDSFAFFPDVNNENRSYLGIEYDQNKFGFRKDMKKLGERILNFFLQGQKVQGQYEKLGLDAQNIFHEIFTKPINFKYKLKDEIHDNNFFIEELTNEQSEILEGTHKNWETLWCEGPAGSGKTVIAIKKFINEYSKQDQKRFLFLCKNVKISEKISEKIENEITDKDKNYRFIGTFDKFCKDILVKNNDDLDFKNLDESYSKVFDYCENEKKFDVIVVDESQDFSPISWTILENIRATDSIFWIFGDSNQKIWNYAKPEIKNINPQSVYLPHILRNSQTIAKKSLSFFDGGGHNIRLDGPISNKFEIIATDSFANEIKKIHKKLRFEGVENESIVMLSSDKNLKKELSSINSSSIFRFKGMEADCVIFVIEDLEKYKPEHLYVGITRAKTFLNILCLPKDKNMIEKMLI